MMMGLGFENVVNGEIVTTPTGADSTISYIGTLICPSTGRWDSEASVAAGRCVPCDPNTNYEPGHSCAYQTMQQTAQGFLDQIYTLQGQVPATQSQWIRGIPNTYVLIGAGLLLLVVAGGRRR